MIIWFSALPVLVAAWIHGSALWIFKLLVAAMIFGSTAWCVRILYKSVALSTPQAAGLIGFVILALQLTIGPFDFGQREHLLIILLLPYILAVATGAADRLSLAERVALGVAAGVGIWFKPQDTLILVALELVCAIRSRSLRRIVTAELLALVFTSVLVLGLTLLLAPLYTRTTLPLLFDTYWALGTATTATLALRSHKYLALVCVLPLTCIALRKYLRAPATTIALTVCSAAAALAYDVQHTDWAYHRYPHLFLIQLAAACLLVDFAYPVLIRLGLGNRLARPTQYAAGTALALLLCVYALRPRIFFVVPQPLPTPENFEELDRFLAQVSPGTTVTVLSTGVPPLSSVYGHGLNWGSRFAHMWMLSAIIQNERGRTGPLVPFKQLAPGRLATLAALQRSETTDDLRYWKPAIVVVQRCRLAQTCQGLEGKDFNMLAWFLQSPDFASAWSNYRPASTLENFDVYERQP